MNVQPNPDTLAILNRNKVDTATVQAVNTVFKTTNYKLFKNIKGNRHLKKAHISSLVRSMKRKALVPPIMLNESMEIIDGQHRFQACRQLDLPVHFIVVPGYQLEEVQELNINQKNWTMKDYMESYIDRGFKVYETYREFYEAYPFNHGICLAILYNRTHDSKVLSDEFKLGKLQITDLEGARRRAACMLDLQRYFDRFASRPFVHAYMEVLNCPRFDHADFLNRLDRGQLLKVAVTKLNYIQQIESIYNFYRQNKVRLWG